MVQSVALMAILLVPWFSAGPFTRTVQACPLQAPAIQENAGASETIEDLRRQLGELKAIQTPTAADKSTIDQLQQAIDALLRSQTNRTKAADLRDLVAQLPQRLELARAAVSSPADISLNATLEQLEQAGTVASAEVTAARAAITEIDAQISQLAERRRLLPDELARARTAYSAAMQAVEATSVPAPGQSSDEAPRQLALARIAERQSAVMLLEAELASLEARGQLTAAQRESAQRRFDTAEETAKSLRARLNDRRREQAEAVATTARETSAESALSPETADPRLAEAAKENLEISNALQAAQKESADIAERGRRLDEAFRRIERDFKVDQERALVAGPTGELSPVLRKQRMALPSTRTLAADAAQIREARIKTDLARINWAIALDDLVTTQRSIANQPGQDALKSLLEERRKTLLLPLQRELDDLSTSLATIEKNIDRLGDLIDDYRGFIDERVLWARSGPPLWRVGELDLPRGTEELRRQVGSAEAWYGVWEQLRSRPLPAILGLLSAALLLMTRPLQRAWLTRLASSVSRGSSDRFVLTLEALLATLMLSMAMPLAMIGVGYALRTPAQGVSLSSAIGSTLLTTASWVALLLFTYRLVRKQGLAADHFGWRHEQLELLRRATFGLVWFGTPFLLAALVIARLSEAERTGSKTIASIIEDGLGMRSLSSFFVLPFLAVMGWAMWTLFRPAKGLATAYMGRNPGLWLTRLRHLWFGALIAIPAMAILLTFLGWGYTAGVLTRKLASSATLAMIVVVLDAVLLRSLEFAARSFANQWRERLLETPTPMPDAEAAQRQEVRSEVAALSRKSRATIRGLSMLGLIGGLVYIWSDLLPALRVLDSENAWEGARGMVTWGSVFWAVVVAALAGFAARNLPGAIEVLVLQHTGVSPGGRYATSAVMGYCIAIIGVIVPASMLGFSWQSVQWLVAAIGVGIGFGLQEIVGNFIAGLIVLFEQPVRVGDVVTVGDRTGQIVKIRIRSTTIRDPDGKDLILPNKDLITERVLNWTLSSAPLRVVVPVGVAYGTELARAERILLDCATSAPFALKTPAPEALLTGFGASSIDFELRCHVLRIEQINPLRHDLMLRIQSAFAKADISIAFPQLDLHVSPTAIEQVVKEMAR